MAVLHLLIYAGVARSGDTVERNETDAQGCKVLQTLRRRQFIVHTDLPVKAAEPFVDRMERTLRRAERYWRRPLRGRIECYLVDDLANWPQGSLNGPAARQVLRHLGGGTALAGFSARTRRHDANVYATTELSVIEHETVHAYCHQTFGTAGPVWYREGMAELFALEVCLSDTEICRPEMRTALAWTSHQPPVDQIVRGNFFANALNSAISRGGQPDGVAVGYSPSWTEVDGQRLAAARVAYARSWALCHLMVHNKNYSTRFRMLGRRLLLGQEVDLAAEMKGRFGELNFEYQRMLRALAEGSVRKGDHWRWSRRWASMAANQRVTAMAAADRGFFPTGVAVSAGDAYHVRCGEPGGSSADERCQWEAIVMTDYTLYAIPSKRQATNPHDASQHASTPTVTLSADRPGHLYVRLCAVPSQRTMPPLRLTIERTR